MWLEWEKIRSIFQYSKCVCQMNENFWISKEELQWIKKTCFSLVRPHLQYCCLIWRPTYNIDFVISEQTLPDLCFRNKVGILLGPHIALDVNCLVCGLIHNSKCWSMSLWPGIFLVLPNAIWHFYWKFCRFLS